MSLLSGSVRIFKSIAAVLQTVFLKFVHSNGGITCAVDKILSG